MSNRPVNAEELFQRGFHIEQQLGPQVYRDTMQAINSLVNVNPTGRLLSTGELQQRAVCLGWIAGLYEGKSLSEVLATREERIDGANGVAL